MARRNPAEYPDESIGLLFAPGAGDAGAVVLFEADDLEAGLVHAEELWDLDRYALGYLNMVEEWCEPDVLSIGISVARKGWGPALYDAAMEWATRHGYRLTPGRESVTQAAKRVWLQYATRRDDVEHRPMRPRDPCCVGTHHEPYLNHTYRRVEKLPWYKARSAHGARVVEQSAADLGVSPERVRERLATAGVSLAEGAIRRGVA